MPSQRIRIFASISCVFSLFYAAGVHAQDLHLKKSLTVGGYTVSTTDTSIKGSRTREVTQSPSGTTVTIRQCDLRRTLHINEQEQSYYQQDEPLSAAEARAAALASGTPAPEENSGKIDVTTTVTDTGERKTLLGVTARHLKSKVVQESSANACNQVHQTFEIDGWYADLGKENAACSTIAPPVPQAQGCRDLVVQHQTGSGKPGYAMNQTITIAGPDGKPTSLTIAVADLSKQPLEAKLFELPKGYRQVSSLADLKGQMAAQTNPAANTMPPATQPVAQAMPSGAPPQQSAQRAQSNAAVFAAVANPFTGIANQQALAQQAMARSGMAGGQFSPGGLPSGMQGMMGGAQPQPAAAQVAAPQALGPKVAGKIRIGIAPPDAQLGQGNNANADYSTPIRNAVVALMSGPAIEIAALDAHVPIQLQAEAQQKQCDFILYSSVVIKHNSGGGGFGSFMKKAAPLAGMTPMGSMAKGMGGAMAAQAASAAASAAAMSAQQQAMNQLTGFNKEIKSKDDVAVQYQLFASGQPSPQLQNELKGKAKSDGEDVLTPLLQQTANAVLTEVTTKK